MNPRPSDSCSFHIAQVISPRVKWIAALAVLMLAGACSSNSQKQIAPQPAEETEFTGPSEYRLSENERLGYLSLVDSSLGIAVLRVDPDLQIPPKGRVISRTSGLKPTGILEITGMVKGSAVGMRILAGSPRIGEEVVAPGPSLRAWGDAVLNKTQVR